MSNTATHDRIYSLLYQGRFWALLHHLLRDPGPNEPNSSKLSSNNQGSLIHDLSYYQSSGLTPLPICDAVCNSTAVHATKRGYRLIAMHLPPSECPVGQLEILNVLGPATRWKGSVVADDRRSTTAMVFPKINFTASSVISTSNVFLPPYQCASVHSIRWCLSESPRAAWSGGASVPEGRIALDCTVNMYSAPRAPQTIVCFGLLGPRSGIGDNVGMA